MTDSAEQTARIFEVDIERFQQDTDFGGRVQLAKVEVDEGENMKLAGQYRLRGFPTVILFYRGAEVARFSGAMSRYRISDWLRAQLPEDLAGSTAL